jgi:thioredoxin 1
LVQIAHSSNLPGGLDDWGRERRKTMSHPNIVHTDDAGFEQEVLAADIPVLVDFWADWCGPCRAIAPHLETLAERYAGRAKIVKLDVDGSPNTPGKYGIRGIPTLLVFKDGEVVDRIVGNPGALGPLDELVSRNL